MTYRNFETDQTECFYNKKAPNTSLSGHDFADFYLMDAFINALYYKDRKLIKTDA